MAKVLVTGANGFVGKRLVSHLSLQGHEIYALCRIKGTQVFPEKIPNIQCIWGDIRNPKTFEAIPSDIEVVYYLVHSMSEVVGNLIGTEQEVVGKFLEGMQGKRVKQIIYLGGIINDERLLSPHLKSRLLVEQSLKKNSIPTTILRASIIIGAGSASFEIIRDLCEKLPLMIAPKWVNSLCQPIAIGDVLFYLSAVLLKQECFNKTFDIGGSTQLTFKEMMLEYGKFRGLKRWILDIPFISPRLSSYWLVFITSVRFSLCYYLVESMRSNSVVKFDDLQKIFPYRCLSYQESLKLTFQKIDQNEVISSWMDSWEIHGIDPNLEDYVEVPKEGCLKDEKKIKILDSKQHTIDRIWSIGGQNGYYGLNWAWSLRGLFDKLFGGVGLNRGRKHPTKIQTGDSIDFWRVIQADRENGILILFAEMKIPGEAWLDFRVETSKGEEILIQTATFRPKGILGRLYWYSLIPFHYFIFRNMAKALAGKND